MARLEIAHTGLRAAMNQAWLWMYSHGIDILKSIRWPGAARARRQITGLVSVSMGKHGGYRGLCMHSGSFSQGHLRCTSSMSGADPPQLPQLHCFLGYAPRRVLFERQGVGH